MTTFKSLGLREDIVNSLKNLEIDKPTEIQEKAIPIVLNEKNLCNAAWIDFCADLCTKK